MPKPQVQKTTAFQRACVGCFIVLFVVSLSMVVMSSIPSIGVEIVNSQYWANLFWLIVGGFAGYLFGGNMKKGSVS